jgi:methionyl-tRNA formyltransferase
VTQRLDTIDSQSKCTCVLASGRPWNRDMADVLSSRIGCDFVLISDPKELTAAKLASINPRFIFFPHWSHRIDSSIFERFECVIFHMTDLPFGRGGSPLQNLIARGIYETKISALRCVKEMDAGPIYLKKPFSLYGSAEEIFLRASGVIEDMIVEMLEKLPEPKPQEGVTTVFKRRSPEEGNLATAESLEQAFDLIRMLDAEGYPNAFLNVGPFKIEFSRASMRSDQVLADVRISIADDAKERDIK